MTIYRAESMPSLRLSRHRKDAEIVSFAKRNKIRSLSHKDYKYLYAALTVDGIQKRITGKGIANLDACLKIALQSAREDGPVEKRQRLFSLAGAGAEISGRINGFASKEISTSSCAEFIRVREQFGSGVADLIMHLLGDASGKKLWESLSKASFRVDSLADLRHDRKAGLVRGVRVQDVLCLAGKCVKHALGVIRELGLVETMNLSAATFLVLKGGFEDDSKKEKQWPIS